MGLRATGTEEYINTFRGEIAEDPDAVIRFRVIN